jgi:preprotein translocase subunit YajC
MLIAKAFAASENAQELADIAANAPTAGEALVMNLGLVVILVGLFYLLLILPQQRRFKEHSSMLSGLKKGDRVVTGGGLVGKIDKDINDKEVQVDLGNGVKVTALRSSLQGRAELPQGKAANDSPDKK